ncbi:MAG: hypothetical protein ABUT20_30850 [Bacteroidota bacterium]
MYTYTWKKYLPVIRILLKRSATASQVLTVNRIDFEKANRVKKPIVSFAVDLAKGRVITINPPLPAKDLLEVLLEDEITRKLIRDNKYSIKFTSSFELHIENTTPVAENDGSTAGAEDSATA